MINSDEVDWRASSVQKCVSEYLTKEAGNTCVEEVSSDDEGGENIEEKEKDLPDITTYEALAMLDQLVNVSVLNEDERASLTLIRERLEIIQINNKRQKSIKDYFK